ncbi:MAG: hypothetical protein V1904_15800 [Bacteroidota bacterium]
MENPIIHIGYPKTGSTWFYNSYYSKIKNVFLLPPEKYLPFIADHNFIFPDTEKDKRLVMIHPEMTGVKNFIWDDGVQRGKIASNLNRIFPSATIVLFLRNQLDFLTSAYIYYVKKGGTYPGSKMLDHIIQGKFEFSLQYLNYPEMIDVFRKYFGSEDVHVYLFENFFSDPKTFMQKYSERYHFDISMNNIDFSPINDKLRKRLMTLMRITNHFTKADNPFKKYYFNSHWVYRNINEVSDSLNSWKIFGKKACTSGLFRQDQIDFIKEYYRASNIKIRDEYGLSGISKYDYPC